MRYRWRLFVAATFLAALALPATRLLTRVVTAVGEPQPAWAGGPGPVCGNGPSAGAVWRR